MRSDIPIVEVDLAEPPRRRWRGLLPHRAALVELLEMYERDLKIARSARDMLSAYRDMQDVSYREELEGIAAMAEVDALDLFLVNAYYDVFKHVMGCTAFAICESPQWIDTDGPLHARNLDWHSESRALERHTIVVRYHQGGRPLFQSVTWPGFIGTLSGMAPGRFSVTLNAVLSDDPPQVATPVTFVLRDLLCSATYQQAVAALRERPLSGDCLLLLAGTEAGELTVIERSPTRAAVRGPEDGIVVVTNDYKALPSESHDGGVLAQTSCGRFDRALARARIERPQTVDGCLAILDDPGVRMSITVQHMVMSARSGLLEVRCPA